MEGEGNVHTQGQSQFPSSIWILLIIPLLCIGGYLPPAPDLSYLFVQILKQNIGNKQFHPLFQSKMKYLNFPVLLRNTRTSMAELSPSSLALHGKFRCGCRGRPPAKQHRQNHCGMSQAGMIQVPILSPKWSPSSMAKLGRTKALQNGRTKSPTCRLIQS